jgi:UDP-glucose 4-epimerase
MPAGKDTAIVTGGAGFIGSHVVDLLLGEGRSVIVLDDLSTGLRDNVAREALLEVVDIANAEAVGGVFETARPSVVYHLAAQASVTRSVADPGRDCAVNVLGTVNLLEAARNLGAPLVFASTGGALYGSDAPLPTSEEAQTEPISPYGASKLSAEGYVATWSRSYSAPHAIMRLGNVYGPRQQPHGEAGVVAIFSDRLWRGEPPTVYGFGRPTRDYVHVHDVVRALRLAEGMTGTYNIATGVETDVSTVLETLQQAAGRRVEPVLEPLRRGELERSCLDPGRASRELGWKAEIGVRAGLESTYDALVEGFERSPR